MISAYPGLVSCDEVTYLRSMLPAYNFKKLPEKMMKNISNPGKMYPFVGPALSHGSCAACELLILCQYLLLPPFTMAMIGKWKGIPWCLIFHEILPILTFCGQDISS